MAEESGNTNITRLLVFDAVYPRRSVLTFLVNLLYPLPGQTSDDRQSIYLKLGYQSNKHHGVTCQLQLLA